MGDTSHQTTLATGTEPNADFEATMTFLSPAPAVFEALTMPEDLSSWWVPATGSGRAGGELTFVMGTKRVVMRVDESEQPSAVTWTTLVCEPVPDWVGTSISFVLSPGEQGGARLHFRHTGLTPQLECFDQCQAGWNHHLSRLVAYVDADHGDTPMRSDA